MKLNLNDLQEMQKSNDNLLGQEIIKRFVKNLFLELTNEFKTNEQSITSEIGGAAIVYAIDFEPGEPHGGVDLDVTIPFGDMDICMRIEWTTYANRYMEGWGYYYENVEHDITKIEFDIFGNEYDYTDDKDAIKVAMDVLTYNE